MNPDVLNDNCPIPNDMPDILDSMRIVPEVEMEAYKDSFRKNGVRTRIVTIDK